MFVMLILAKHKLCRCSVVIENLLPANYRLSRCDTLCRYNNDKKL